MLERIQRFLKPDKEKLKIFALLVPAAIAIIIVGFDLETHIDNPSVMNPISQMVPEDYWTNGWFFFFVIFLYLLGVVLSLPAMILTILFSALVPNPYFKFVVFLVLEAAYLYIISCIIHALLGILKGNRR